MALATKFDVNIICINRHDKHDRLQPHRHVTQIMTATPDPASACATSPALTVLKKFRLLFGSVRQHFREVESRCGISGSQLWILQEVQKQPEIGIGELATALSIHQSTCSLLVEKLVKKGLLRKDRRSDDQRRVGLLLTATATSLLANAPGPAEGLLPDALLAMSPAELAQLDTALDSLLGKLQNQNPRFADKPLAEL